MPVCVAATAMQRMAHHQGETATARGTHEHADLAFSAAAVISGHLGRPGSMRSDLARKLKVTDWSHVSACVRECYLVFL